MAATPGDPNEVADLLREMIRLQGGSAVSSRVSRDSGAPDPDLWKNVTESTKRYTAQLKDATKFTTSFSNVLEGGREDLGYVFENLKDKFHDLAEAQAQAVDEADVNAVRAQRAELIKAAVNKIALTSVSNFGAGMLKAANTLLDGTRSFELSIQSGATGVAAGTEMLIASIEAQRQVNDTTADAFKDLTGGIGSLALAFTGITKYIALAIGILGPLVGSFYKFDNDQRARAEKHRAKLFGEELKKTEENYHIITTAGAIFVDGMGEMRAQAANAGMRLKDFSEMIKNSAPNLANMGMGLAQAAQRIGGVSKILRSSDLGMQLRNLGLNAQEQGEAAAAAAANLNASGRLRSMSDAKVAEVTVAYTKDLKILQGITGEDAKKKMEEARVRSMEADLMAQAMAKGGPEAMEKLRNQLATMPESMKKGYMEFVSTGGTAVADAATNVAIAQNPKIMAQYQQMYTTLGDGSKDASAALRETGSLTEETAKYAREHAASVKEMGLAARVGASDIGAATMTIHNDLILANQKFTEGVTAATAENVDNLSQTQDPLTKSLTRLEEETNSAAVKLEKELTPALKQAADELPRFTRAMQDAIDALHGLDPKRRIMGEEERFGEVTGSLAGGIGAGAIGAGIGSVLLPGIGTVVGGALGSAIGGYLGGKAGGAVGSAFDEKDRFGKPKTEFVKKDFSWTDPASWFAKGGIASGPTTGFPAMLHGTEAVVPLPDGKALPVNLDLGNSSLLASIGKLTADSVTKDMPSKLSEDTAAMIKQLTDTISAYNQNNSNDASSKALEDMASLMKSQLDKHDEMISHLKETVDINQRLLNQSYA